MKVLTDILNCLLRIEKKLDNNKHLYKNNHKNKYKNSKNPYSDFKRDIIIEKIKNMRERNDYREW